MWARVKSAKRKIKNLGEHPILVDPDQGQDLVVADADGLFMDLILLGIETVEPRVGAHACTRGIKLQAEISTDQSCLIRGI